MTMTSQKSQQTGINGFSSATLHIIAMVSMLIDHTLKTVVECDSWVLVLGRLAFPLFAFMTSEGYFHTRNFRKYALRMLAFAVVSEVPYDLMKSGTAFERYDQNVLWTFLIALFCMWAIDKVKSKGKEWLYILTAIAVSFAGLMLGMLFEVDYGGMGVLTVLVFYFFRERKWWCRILQVILMFIINAVFLGGLGYGISVTAFGAQMEIPLQAFAVLALIPIWLYRGRQGYHSKPFQYICYAFYPVHMAVLAVISAGLL